MQDFYNANAPSFYNVSMPLVPLDASSNIFESPLQCFHLSTEVGTFKPGDKEALAHASRPKHRAVALMRLKLKTWKMTRCRALQITRMGLQQHRLLPLTIDQRGPSRTCVTIKNNTSRLCDRRCSLGALQGNLIASHTSCQITSCQTTSCSNHMMRTRTTEHERHV